MIIRKLLNYWFSKKRSDFYIWMAILSVGMYAAGAVLRSGRSPALSSFLEQTGFLSFLLVLLALFIHLNLHANHWFLDHFQETDHLPVRQISHVNSFCMTLFLCLSLLAFLGAAYGLEPFWQMIGRFLADRRILDEAVYPALEMEKGPAMEAPDLSAFLGEPKPTPVWMEALDRILRILVTVFLAVLVLLAIRSLLRQVWAWITKPRHFDGDEKIYLTPTWALPSGQKKAALHRSIGRLRTYDDKIRQLYRRNILVLSRQKKISPPKSASPSELEQAVGLEHRTLHELYEKARYSQKACTRAEWESLSRSLKAPGKKP